MKIGFVIDDSLDKPDGVQQYVLTVGQWLAAQGHTVHYLVGETKRKDITNLHSLSRNISVNFNKNRLSIPLPSSKRRLMQLIDAEKFDVLHIQMPHSPFLAASIVRLAQKRSAIVGTFHIAPYSHLEAAATKALGLWLKKNISYFDQIISVSRTAQDFAHKTFGIESKVVPNAVDMSMFKAESTKHNEPIMTFLGRLVPRKGCLELLEAYNLLKEKPRLVICGDGSDRQTLEYYCKKHDLRNVEFVGFIHEDEKKTYLANSDIAVFPSISGESFGIVLIEAMAAGAGVVIAGDNPGYQTVMGSIPEAMINPHDTKAFANVLQTFLSDAQKAKEVHAKQQELVKQYDINVVGPQILACYEQALKEKTKV